MKIKTRRVGKLSLVTITSRGSVGVFYLVLWGGRTMFGGGLGHELLRHIMSEAGARAAYDWCDI